MPTVTSNHSLAGTSYERVRDQLRSDIVGGKLAPGFRLKVADLARQYGLSLMPVREALQQLQGEGLVVVVPKRGAIVRVPDIDLVSQIFEIRIALERILARRAAAVATPADLKVLRKALERHKKGRGDHEAHMQDNLHFHQVINGMSGNEEATKILDRHNQILFGLRRSVGFGSGQIDRSIQDHQQIYDAIAAGDQDAAERVTEGHVERARDDMLACMRTPKAS